MDTVFLTRQGKNQTLFEKKYLERFPQQEDIRIGLPGLSPQLVDKQKLMEKTEEDLRDARSKFDQYHAR